MIYVKILAAVALIGSVVWVIAEPGFDSALSVAGSATVLASAFVVEKRSARRKQQQQTVSKNSTGIQAGGDVNIGSIGDKRVK